ncbi:MAG: acyl-CoA thioesterase [Lachnospiraceae bacterium]|jgi:acyl-CoA thioester hydrolase|nr:acyl-CoA thioesterase [Lachnospiraceae bacterium]
MIKPYQHKVHYYETDQMSIVHHSNYIRWFEEARCDILEQLGIGYAKLEAQGIMIPVLSISCEYKTMTRFGDTVHIFGRILYYDGVRLKMGYEVKDAATGELRCMGESSHCFLHAGGPISLKRKYSQIDTLFRNYLCEEPHL